jgi:hypothetical protein
LAVGEPFQGLSYSFDPIPGLSLRANPGLKLANAFGVQTGPARLDSILG